MATDTKFIDVVNRFRQNTPESEIELPVRSGRSSVSESDGYLGSLIAEMAVVDPDYPIKMLDAMEHLGKYHNDFSYAIDNIVQLGNTFQNDFHGVFFDDSVSDEQAKEMISHLKTKARKWYAHSGGVNSLINDLLAQTAITGALSAENVIERGLTGVEKVVLVNPKHIRFIYDRPTDSYKPHQQQSRGIKGIGIKTNLLALNEVTYKYLAIRRFNEKPYAIPPFLSALEDISDGKHMKESMRFAIKKLGIMGFLKALVRQPNKGMNETPSAYQTRSAAYLNSLVPEIEKGLQKGYVLGFKDSAEFEMQSTTGNVAGAKDLIEINDVKVMSGLKQDPLMFGRNFSTTETLGRVVLAKMLTQIKNYQSLVETYLSELFHQELALAGFDVKFVEVEFDPPMIADKVKEEEAYGKRIENQNSLYSQGIIGQQERAQALGFEEPDQEEPRPSPVAPAESGNTSSPTEPTKKTDPAEEKETTANEATVTQRGLDALEVMLNGHLPEYPYTVQGCNCATTVESFSDGGDLSDLEDFIREYYDATKANYTRAVKKVTTAIVAALSKFDEGATDSQVYDSVIYHLYNNWEAAFTRPQKKIIRKWVTATYNFFRKDKSVFADTVDGIPKGTLRTLDLRAIEYFKDMDELYLGKFITDEDTKKKLNKFIREEFLENRVPIGGNEAVMQKFKAEFGNLMAGQEWKITRIILTTVNKLRNTAAVAYMDQAEVEKYEIRGITDRLQCGYCKALQGKQFKVSLSMDYIKNTVSSDPEIVKADAPFITSIYKKPEDMENLTAEQLQSANVHFPPFHPGCRDQAIAVL